MYTSPLFNTIKVNLETQFKRWLRFQSISLLYGFFMSLETKVVRCMNKRKNLFCVPQKKENKTTHKYMMTDPFWLNFSFKNNVYGYLPNTLYMYPA